MEAKKKRIIFQSSGKNITSVSIIEVIIPCNQNENTFSNPFYGFKHFLDKEIEENI